jgi:phytoene dehydrogenase-like protein
MEQEYGLIGGNIFHGELSLEQLFHMRPAPGYADYRTPIAGLYNGSLRHARRRRRLRNSRLAGAWRGARRQARACGGSAAR